MQNPISEKSADGLKLYHSLQALWQMFLSEQNYRCQSSSMRPSSPDVTTKTIKTIDRFARCC